MFCNNCGATIGPGQTYCNNCGVPVPRTAVQQTQMIHDTQARTNPVQPQPYAQPVQQPVARRSNPLTPILAALCGVLAMVLVALCLVLGGVIHIGDTTTDTTTVESSTSAASATQTTDEDEATADEDEPQDESTSDTESTSQTDTSQTDTSSAAAVTQEPEPTTQTQPSTSGGSTSSAASGYILPDSNSRYYSQDELSGFSNWELYVARNEIYARHGRKFRKEDLREYFKSCSWYTELYDPGYFETYIEPSFNDYERKNADTIKAVEGRRGSPYLN